MRLRLTISGRAVVAMGMLCAGFYHYRAVAAGPAAGQAGAAITRAPAFDARQLTALPTSSWITNGGNVFNQRYSPLTLLNRDNVAGLKALWRTGMGSGAGAGNSGQAQILVSGDALYISNGANDVFHVADYLAHQVNAGNDAGVAGAILTSGFYELGGKVSVWKDYYGDDVSQYPARSSLPGLLKTATPLFVTYAELDPEMFQSEAQRLIEARAQGGRPVRWIRLSKAIPSAIGNAARSSSTPSASKTASRSPWA